MYNPLVLPAIILRLESLRRGVATHFSRLVKLGLLLGIFFAVLALAFYFSAVPIGGDWNIFYQAGWRFLAHEPLYSSGYFNPPLVALALVPLVVLPERVSYSIFCALTLLLLLAFASRYRMSRLRTLCLVVSPLAFDQVRNGQIDVLVMACVLLPASCWPIAVFAKPQAAVGLLSRPTRSGIAVLLIVAVISFAIAPDWPMQLLASGSVARLAYWNVMRSIWPLSVSVGMLLLFKGWSTNDERYWLAASPLFFPYAAVGSFFGLWLLACCLLPRRHLVATFVALWVVLPAWLLLILTPT